MHMMPREHFNELVYSKTIPCVSIYLPTHRSGQEAEQDPIRLKNLLREAEQYLIKTGIRGPEAKKILEPAQELLADPLFWRHQDDGLALFVAPGFFRHYCLPLLFEERVIVSDRFHITPLLPLFTADGRFYVLALNKKQIRLFRCTHLYVKEVDLHNVPTNIGELLKYKVAQEQLNLHSVGATGTGAGMAIFHGQGVGTDDASRKKDVLEFFQMVNRNMMKILNGERAPLVLAGVEYERAMYREVNTYPYLVAEGINGSTETATASELHDRAWTILEPHFKRAFDDDAARFKQGVNTARTSSNLKEVVQAAVEGRVDVLFVHNGYTVWGVVDPKTGSVELHDRKQPNDRNLQDFVAIQTLSKGGTVYVVEAHEAPVRTPLAAVFRY
jgi:hypothetical protein